MDDLISHRLKQYQCSSELEEDQALQEIAQEFALYGLSKTSFFRDALFLGGTCLRIVHGIRRYSEDLDFELASARSTVALDSILNEVIEHTAAFGLHWQLSGADKKDSALQRRFLKEDSLKKVLSLHYPQKSRRRIKIKIGMDGNPPEGAMAKYHTLFFPGRFTLRTHTVDTLIAGKIAAVLCRPWDKGRDWFDLEWYSNHPHCKINLVYLQSALSQNGLLEANTPLDVQHVGEMLIKKTQDTNWRQARMDVERFLRPNEQQGLALWNADYFSDVVSRLLVRQRG